MYKQLIYGPPGTGKTTYLMGLLQEELERTPSEEIAFVSFTRKGTNEGTSRAKKLFNLRKVDTPYFRTLHSLCYRALGVNRSAMFNRSHYRTFSNATGIHFVGHYCSDFTCTNDLYLHAAAMELHNPAMAEKMLRELNNKKFDYIKFQFNAMKRQLGLRTFDDLLVDYLKEGEVLPVKVAFIDEAQDLTPLQWKIVRKMFSKAERIYVAGDDDQAVFEWSGADVKEFMSFSKTEPTVLGHSYRLPNKILNVAKKITKDIRVRQAKDFNDKGEQGTVYRCDKVENIHFKGGELLLARTNSLLKKHAASLQRMGIPFKIKGKHSINNHTLHAIQLYQDFVAGKATYEESLKLKSYFKEPSRMHHWTTQFKGSEAEARYYERAMLTGLQKIEPVRLETFHSSKGGEADHVIVATDMTRRVYDNYHAGRDAELRCLYVAVTRAKEQLTLVTPSTELSYPQHYFVNS